MKIKIRTSSILYFLFLCLYFRPARYLLGETVDNLCQFVLCLFSAYFMMSAIMNIVAERYHPTGTAIAMSIFFGWCMIVSTFANYFISGNVSFIYAITTFLFELGMILSTDIGLERNPKQYLKLFTGVGGFFSTVNAATMFIYGRSGGLRQEIILDGRTISNNYFYFCEDNASFFLVWPVLVITWITYFSYNRTRKMLVWSILFTLITTTSYFYTWSVNNIVGCLGTIAILVYFWRKTGKKHSNNITNPALLKFIINKAWILSFIFNYLLVISQIFLHFSDFVVNVLHKSLTLSGRTKIWEKCIEYINKQPLIGYGYETRSITISKIYFNHAHNSMLEILYRGGLIGMILFIILMLVLWKKEKRHQNASVVLLLSSFVVLFLFLSSIEFTFYRYPYIAVFILLGRCEVLVNTDKELKL